MYKKVKIEHFRGIASLELKNLERFNLFVGKNNCGKTSILESIFLLSGPTNVDLPVTINHFRGYHLLDEYSWSLIFNKLDTLSPIRFTGEWVKPKEKRELVIKPFSEMSAEDSRTIRREKINGLSLEYAVSAPGRKNNGKMVSRIRWAESKLQRDFSDQPVQPVDSIKGIFIHPRSGLEDTAHRFNEIQIKKQEDAILKILQKVEPGLIDLSIGAENILYCDIGFNQRLPINSAGEGLNRLLSIILAIYDASGGILLIDEIENSLHYSAQEVLWEAIFTAANAFDVQIFATTHSFENIMAYDSAFDKFEDHPGNLRLYRIEKENEQLRVIDFDRHTLKTAIQSEWEVR
jgi:AAA15 family ATPase/GTPase